MSIEEIKKRLKMEHKWVEEQVIRYLETTLPEYKKAPRKYEEYINKFLSNIERNLYPHHRFEEEMVFPHITDVQLTEELTEEHREIEEIIKSIRINRDIYEKMDLLNKLLKTIKNHLKKEDGIYSSLVD